MQSAALSNPALAPLSQADLIVLNEKTYELSYESFYYCTPKCVTHYGEESLPYTSGEKTCLDRCMRQLGHAQTMALEAKRRLQEQLNAKELPYAWMRQVAHNEVAI